MILETVRQRLTTGGSGLAVWESLASRVEFHEVTAGIIVCDMWDRHWSRGATGRVNALASHMNTVLKAAREKGLTVIHCPSETMDHYEGAPARRRAQQTPFIPPPEESPLYAVEPELPVDASDGGSDTGETEPCRVWSCQHPAIEIDQNRDFITDDGQELLNIAASAGLNRFLIMGVHTNMCVLRRSFAIMQLVKWRIPVYLVRDLTDAMYNPARPPYVSHEEGTRLVVEYIEKFWCPTVTSAQILG
jgi:nicotinamidase-related amidase